MKNNNLFVLAGVSILIYKLLSPSKKNDMHGIGDIDDLASFSDKMNSNEKVYIELGQPTEYEISEIKRIHNIDVSEYTHIVDNYAVRHTIKKHAKDAFPISKKDLKLIPIITKHPDSIQPGKDKKTNSNRVLYTKKIKGYDYKIEYILEVRTGKKNLAMVTMYKKPAK